MQKSEPAAKGGTPSPVLPKSTLRERKNWYIYLLYTRKEFTECLRVIEEQLKACNGQSEYPLYVKGSSSLYCIVLCVHCPVRQFSIIYSRVIFLWIT